MKVVRLRPYLRAMSRMGVHEEAMRKLEIGLVSAPDAHPIVKGLRGVRKARYALSGRGKSGGARVIYYVHVGQAIYMMTAYPKNEQDDLTNDQRKAILAAIESIKGVRT